MPEVGVRELKTRVSQIIRDVRERRAYYTITYRGRPVGLLTPLEEARPATNGWTAYARLAETLRQAWPAEQRTQSLMDEIRRE